MRISDWSSDVCSSDLTALIYLRRRDLQPQRFRRAGFQAKIRSTPLLQVASDSGRLHGRMKAAHALYQEWGEGWPVLQCRAPRPAIRLTARRPLRSEEHPSELQSLMRISYALCCWKKKTSVVYH